MSHRLDGWPGVDVQSFGALLFVPGTTRPKYGGEGYEIAADNVAALADGGDPDGSAALASSASTRSTPTGGSGSGPGCGRSVASIGQSFGAGSACPAPGAWPTTGKVPWRSHRHGHPLPRLPHPDPVDLIHHTQ